MNGPGSFRWKYVGYRLRVLREERGLSVAELAAHSGYSEEFISGVEVGEEYLGKTAGFILGLALGVDWSEGVDA